MPQHHWLSRSRSAQEMARRATGAEARLIHYHLAGVYSMKADRARGLLPMPITEADQRPEQSPASEPRQRPVTVAP
jgi:hypothetical protein